MKPPNKILSGYGTTVFEVMSRLAIEYKTINLGQGFPDEDGPDRIKEMLTNSTHDYHNQYPPMLGISELRQAVAGHNERFYGLSVDWETEILVTSGATEALASAILALIEPGDEAILFEPLYDCYLPMLLRAGAIPKLLRLEPPNWELNLDELASLFSDKTKLILINSPMNPTGKVFSLEELKGIAFLMQKFDSYAICDEVYEHLVFDDAQHVPLMTYPGMRERVVRIGSAGKTFSMTSWKVGYLTASKTLMAVIAKAHQFLVFTTPSNLQRAVAYGLDNEAAWYTGLASHLQKKRDLMVDGLTDIGFQVLDCKSTYFMNADFRSLGFDGNDQEFCRDVTVNAGVTVLPVSALYASSGSSYLVRFCFCKKNEVLESALQLLRRYFNT